MTTEDIISQFNLQVDDASELSSVEELSLLNDVYKNICNDRDWEWMKKTYTGVMSTTLPYVALPTDFKKMMPNYSEDAEGNLSYVLVGTTYSPYKVIPFSNRRNYRDMSGYCYVDMTSRRLYFTKQPTSAEAIEYDYIKIADDLEDGDEPIFNSDFHKIIFYGMAMKFPSIEQANKVTSYAADNRAEYRAILGDMAIEDANIKLSQ